MRYIGHLIKQIGRETKNPRSQVTATSGVTDDELLEYFNDAQNRLVATILTNQGQTRRFDSQVDIPVVSGQLDYNIPAGSGFARGIRKVEYWRGREFYRLDPLLFHAEWDETSMGEPAGYLLIGNKIRLSCSPPSGAFLRVYFTLMPPNLDIRRGKISNPLSGGGFYGGVQLDLNTVDSIGFSEIGTDFYASVVDRDGQIIVPGIPCTTYDSGTGILAFEPNELETTQGPILAGHFVCFGKNSTTHCSLSQVSDIVETFLKAYVVKKLAIVDSSVDVMESDTELKGIAQQIFELISAEYLDNLSPGLYYTPWME